MQHTQRIQAVLEEANIKLSSVISDVLGKSGQRILKAIIAGETDSAKLAELGGSRLSASRTELTAALHGHGTFYQDLGADHFARRDPARAANKLADRIRKLGYAVDIRAAA